MKNKYVTTYHRATIVLLTAGLCACAPMTEKPFDFDPDDCAVVTFEKCQTDTQINVIKTTLDVNPKNYCAKVNSTVKFNISPGNLGVNTVKTMPKEENEFNMWLHGINSSDQKEIELKVPANTLVMNDYYVVFEDGTCIDPRITVRDF